MGPIRPFVVVLFALPPLAGCLSSSAHVYDGPVRPAGEEVRVHTGEGFWGDKSLYLAEVNGQRLWEPSSWAGQMFQVFRRRNDARVLPGEVELVAGGGQRVHFRADPGATYRLSLVDSVHDSIPVLVVVRERDAAFVADSEPRMDALFTAPWAMEEGWHLVDWRRYRPPHAARETDVVLYQRTPPEGTGPEWSGATWITSLGQQAEPRPGEAFALAADLQLDLELDYTRLAIELLRDEPRLLRFRGRARDGGSDVSGFVVVGRAGKELRGMSCVGPGAWAQRAERFQERLCRAVGRSR